MRVTHDVSPIVAGGTGVARYGVELGRALERLGVHVRRVAFGRRVFAPPPDTWHIPIPLRFVHALWRFPYAPGPASLTRRVDVVHALDLMVPPSRTPVVATVHDLLALDHPSLHSPRAIRQQEAQLATLHRASWVIAISEHTRQALIRHGVDGGRISTVHLGLTPLAAGGAQSVVPTDRPTVLFVGDLGPRKGYAQLAEAARIARGAITVVHVGAGHDESPWVIHAGRLDDDGLAAAYRDASILSFPSLEEGFGLPVIEAMAAGLPVVASDLPVVREVAGDAVAFVRAGDPEALAAALVEMVADADLRARHAERGRVRAAAFTWDRTAAATAEVYVQARRCG